MKSLVVLACVLLSVTLATSQEVGFTLTVTNVLPSSRPSGTITLGGHPNATNGIDAELGEREIPSLPPPAGVFIIYTVPPTPDLLWLSPKDLRKTSGDSSTLHVYDLNMTWTGGRLELSTKQRLPAGIDSAYIVDAITDFPNNFIKARVDSGMVYTTDNPAITRLKVLVWYRPAVTSVDDDGTPSLVIAPNPMRDVLTVTGCEPGSTVDVYTTVGQHVRSLRVETMNMQLLVHDLPIGTYVVRVADPRGRATQRIIVRQ